MYTPLWQYEVNRDMGDDKGLPSLTRDLETDFVIIGGGFTGLSAAYFLKTV
jgi:ribulose 1,5-bisphosphate synthetase/thiazole synthase